MWFTESFCVKNCFCQNLKQLLFVVNVPLHEFKDRRSRDPTINGQTGKRSPQCQQHEDNVKVYSRVNVWIYSIINGKHFTFSTVLLLAEQRQYWRYEHIETCNVSSLWLQVNQYIGGKEMLPLSEWRKNWNYNIKKRHSCQQLRMFSDVWQHLIGKETPWWCKGLFTQTITIIYSFPTSMSMTDKRTVFENNFTCCCTDIKSSWESKNFGPHWL